KVESHPLPVAIPSSRSPAERSPSRRCCAVKRYLAMSAEARNVLLIISDTLRRDCVSVYGEPGWFGRPIDTPHLERFSQRATGFDRAYSSSFPTVPLRNDILTGRATFTY